MAINSWHNPVSGWYISVPENEIMDEKLYASGYTQKRFQFYVPVSPAFNTIPVYESRLANRKITIPFNEGTWPYIKKRDYDKTFLFFGIRPNDK